MGLTQPSECGTSDTGPSQAQNRARLRENK